MTKSITEVFEKCEHTGAWYGVEITNIVQRNFMDDTLLHTVCSWGDLDAVKILVEAGADVNAKGDRGATPLFNAVNGKNEHVVSYLLSAGADVKIENEYGRKVYEYAVNVSAKSEILKLLKGRKL